MKKTVINLLRLSLLVVMTGCGADAALLLNPAFVNQIEGGVLFPLAPRPDTGLLFIRANNATTESITFLITVERSTLLVEGNTTMTLSESKTTEVFTEPGSNSNDAGILFNCDENNQITRIGLGRNLNQPSTDAGLFIGGFNDVIPGFGVPGNINPLDALDGDFECGDTIVYRAIQSVNQPGGFRVQAFIIPWENQPDNTTRNTFDVASQFLGGRPTE